MFCSFRSSAVYEPSALPDIAVSFPLSSSSPAVFVALCLLHTTVPDRRRYSRPALQESVLPFYSVRDMQHVMQCQIEVTSRGFDFPAMGFFRGTDRLAKAGTIFLISLTARCCCVEDRPIFTATHGFLSRHHQAAFLTALSFS